MAVSKVTLVRPPKLTPVRVTVLPPAVGPVGGEKPVMSTVLLLAVSERVKLAGAATPPTLAVAVKMPGRPAAVATALV